MKPLVMNRMWQRKLSDTTQKRKKQDADKKNTFDNLDFHDSREPVLH